MSTRQENQKLLMATHLPTFKRLGISDPYFIAKSAWAPPGEPLRLQIFPSELAREKDIYTEFSDFQGVSEDPTHTLYKLKHNPFYKEEYVLEKKTSKDGKEYEVYLVPVEELVAIDKSSGKEIPYTSYQDFLKNPPEETQKADFPNFAEEYLGVGLKKEEKKEEIQGNPWYENDLEKYLHNISKQLERIANILETKNK
jgi:hypothetical protein